MKEVLKQLSATTLCFQHTYHTLLDMLRHFSPSAHWMRCRCTLRCDQMSRSPLWVCWTARGSSTASSCGVLRVSASNRSPRSDIEKRIRIVKFVRPLKKALVQQAYFSNVSGQSIKNISGHLCTLTCYRDNLKDSWKQEVRNMSKDNRKCDEALLGSLSVLSGV